MNRTVLFLVRVWNGSVDCRMTALKSLKERARDSGGVEGVLFLDGGGALLRRALGTLDGLDLVALCLRFR